MIRIVYYFCVKYQLVLMIGCNCRSQSVVWKVISMTIYIPN